MDHLEYQENINNGEYWIEVIQHIALNGPATARELRNAILDDEDPRWTKDRLRERLNKLAGPDKPLKRTDRRSGFVYYIQNQSEERQSPIASGITPADIDDIPDDEKERIAEIEQGNSISEVYGDMLYDDTWDTCAVLKTVLQTADGREATAPWLQFAYANELSDAMVLITLAMAVGTGFVYLIGGDLLSLSISLVLATGVFYLVSRLLEHIDGIHTA